MVCTEHLFLFQKPRIVHMLNKHICHVCPQEGTLGTGGCFSELHWAFLSLLLIQPCTLLLLKHNTYPGMVDYPPVIPVLGKMRQEDCHEFNASLGYLEMKITRKKRKGQCLAMKLWFGCVHQFYALKPLSPMQQQVADTSRPDYMPELCFMYSSILLFGEQISHIIPCSPCSHVLTPHLCYASAVHPTSPLPLCLLPCNDIAEAFTFILDFTAPELYASKFLFIIKHIDLSTLLQQYKAD